MGGLLAYVAACAGQTATLKFSPSTVSFTAALNGPPPPLETLNVIASDGSLVSFGVLVDGGVTGTPAPPWLTVTPSQGTTPALIRLWVNQSGLGAGAQSARVQLTDRTGKAFGVIANINLQVLAGDPALAISPGEIHFSSSISAGNIQQSILVQSLGPGSLAPVSVSVVSGYPWLRANVVSCDSVCVISVAAVVAALAPGPHNGMLNVITGLGSRMVPVSLFAGDHGPYLRLSEDTAQFETVQGTAFSDSRTVWLINGGDMSSVWTATVAGNASWLSVTPTSGTL
ncbi:MAG TPA: hypothetical protein VKT49_00130, partial [Bryobacteraceae bacterium]|nr:hypothetical protein [Bryobacteraceae bacterium]